MSNLSFQQDPCVQSGHSLVPFLVGFFVGFVVLPGCCCLGSRIRHRRQMKKTYPRKNKSLKERQVNIADLAHLMDRDQDSDFDLL